MAKVSLQILVWTIALGVLILWPAGTWRFPGE